MLRTDFRTILTQAADDVETYGTSADDAIARAAVSFEAKGLFTVVTAAFESLCRTLDFPEWTASRTPVVVAHNLRRIASFDHALLT